MEWPVPPAGGLTRDDAPDQRVGRCISVVWDAGEDGEGTALFLTSFPPLMPEEPQRFTLSTPLSHFPLRAHGLSRH